MFAEKFGKVREVSCGQDVENHSFGRIRRERENMFDILPRTSFSRSGERSIILETNSVLFPIIHRY